MACCERKVVTARIGSLRTIFKLHTGACIVNSIEDRDEVGILDKVLKLWN